MKRILWETYFDNSISRSGGRRVRKNFPKEKLVNALNALSLNYSISESKFPRTPWKTEKKIEVEWDKSKEELIKKIEEKALSEPSESSQEHQ